MRPPYSYTKIPREIRHMHDWDCSFVQTAMYCIILKLESADLARSTVLSEITTRNKICNRLYCMENLEERERRESATTILPHLLEVPWRSSSARQSSFLQKSTRVLSKAICTWWAPKCYCANYYGIKSQDLVGSPDAFLNLKAVQG
jgi:hypothetical protein